MRKLLGIGAVVLGGVGVLLCATAVGIGWWAAVRTAARLDRVAARLDHGLSEVDVQLARVESRVNAIRTDLDAVRGAAETIAAENPDLPRVQAEIERLLDRLVPTLERADALADSLRSAAAGLRTAADIVDQLTDDPAATVRVRSAAEKIDRAAEALNGLRARVEASKSAKAVRLARELGASGSRGDSRFRATRRGARCRPPRNRRRPRADGRMARQSRLLDLRGRDRKHARLVVGRSGPTVPDRLGATATVQPDFRQKSIIARRPKSERCVRPVAERSNHLKVWA